MISGIELEETFDEQSRVNGDYKAREVHDGSLHEELSVVDDTFRPNSIGLLKLPPMLLESLIWLLDILIN